MEEEQNTGKEHSYIYYLQEEKKGVGIYKEGEEQDTEQFLYRLNLRFPQTRQTAAAQTHIHELRGEAGVQQSAHVQEIADGAGNR